MPAVRISCCQYHPKFVRLTMITSRAFVNSRTTPNNNAHRCQCSGPFASPLCLIMSTFNTTFASSDRKHIASPIVAVTLCTSHGEGTPSSAMSRMRGVGKRIVCLYNYGGKIVECSSRQSSTLPPYTTRLARVYEHRVLGGLGRPQHVP